MYFTERGRALNGSETVKPERGGQGRGPEADIKSQSQRMSICYLTSIYCVPIYMSNTVLGPDDIVVKKKKKDSVFPNKLFSSQGNKE